MDRKLESEINEALGELSMEEILSLEDRPSPTPSGRVPVDRSVRTGRVMKIHESDVFVELAANSEGVCPLAQFDEPPQIGDELDFVVERFDAFDGLMILSRKGAVQKAVWENIEVGQVIEARCVGMNRGGLEMEVDHHKAFMPSGQVDLQHVPDISVFIGEKFPCKVIELRKDKKRLVLSRKSVLMKEQRQRRKELLESIEAGKTLEAKISSIQPYGAFADLGGIDGLIHVSDLCYEHINNPEEVVSVGDTVQVKVLKVDKSKKPVRISLGRRQTMPNPAKESMASLEEGQEITGKVTKVMEFGAFVEVGPGLEGLVHISELSYSRVPSVESVVKPGDEVTAKIKSIDSKKNRISLSIKALQDPPKRSGNKRDDAHAHELREEDPEMRKLKARFSGELKGGLGTIPGES